MKAEVFWCRVCSPRIRKEHEVTYICENCSVNCEQVKVSRVESSRVDAFVDDAWEKNR